MYDVDEMHKAGCMVRTLHSMRTKKNSKKSGSTKGAEDMTCVEFQQSFILQSTKWIMNKRHGKQDGTKQNRTLQKRLESRFKEQEETDHATPNRKP